MEVCKSERAEHHLIDYSPLLGITINAGATASLTFTFTVMEAIKISPMYYSEYALHGIKDMVYTAQFANHHRMLCIGNINAGLTINSVTPTLTDFELYFAYSTPKLLANIPNSIVYPYQFIDYYPTAVSGSTATVAGANATVSFNAINLSSVPRKLIIWVSELNANLLPVSLLTNVFKFSDRSALLNAIILTI